MEACQRCKGRGVFIHPLTAEEEEALYEGGGWDGIEYCDCEAGKQAARIDAEFYRAAMGRCGHGPECLCWDHDDWRDEDNDDEVKRVAEGGN